MPISITHGTTATGTNDAGKQVSVTAWNQAHTVTGAMENPMTAAADLVVGGVSGAPARLAKGTDGQVLKIVSGAVAWGSDATGAGSGGLTNETGTDADTTMTVGKMHIVDMSAWATADRTYTLPATATAGDQIGVLISAGNASTFELIVTAASGDTLNGIAGGTEWSRLFITGECLIFRCVADNSAWIVERDGRIACKSVLRLTTAATAEVANTFTSPTDKGGAWTADSNIGDCGAAATGRFTARRSGIYTLTARATTANAIGTSQWYDVRTVDQSAATIAHSRMTTGPDATASLNAVVTVPMTAGQYQDMQYRSLAGSKGMANGYYSVSEVL